MNQLARTRLRKTRSRMTPVLSKQASRHHSSSPKKPLPVACRLPPPTCPGCRSNTKLNLAGAATSLISTFIVKRGISADSTGLSLGLRRWEWRYPRHPRCFLGLRPTNFLIRRRAPKTLATRAGGQGEVLPRGVCPSLPFSWLPTTRLSLIFVDWEVGVAHRPAAYCYPDGVSSDLDSTKLPWSWDIIEGPLRDVSPCTRPASLAGLVGRFFLLPVEGRDN